GLGQEILKRWPVDLFQIGGVAVTGIEIVAEERAEIDLIKRIFFLGFRTSFVLLFNVFCVLALVGLFAPGHFVQQGDRGIQFSQIDSFYFRIVTELLRSSGAENAAFINNVSAIGDRKRFTHIVVRD